MSFERRSAADATTLTANPLSGRWGGWAEEIDRPAGARYGPAFFERVLEEGVGRRVKHYFLGSTPETLEKLQRNLYERFPGVDIVGVSSPPFKDFTPDDYAVELSKIETSKPDIVWVGLGTPKQDKAGAYLASYYPAVSLVLERHSISVRATYATSRSGYKMQVLPGYFGSSKSRDGCGVDTPMETRSSYSLCWVS